MRTPPQDLEPAVRDPRKLRRTALILVGVAIVGGFMVLKAYNRKVAELAQDERPAFAHAQLLQRFKVARQDLTEEDLLHPGGVVVLSPVSFEQPDGWSTTRGVLGGLARHYAGDPRVRIVNLTVNPAGETAGELPGFAGELGAELPQWWVAGAEEESIRKLLAKLKTGVPPHLEGERWVYDPSLLLIDREGRLRKATVRMRKPDGTLLNERRPIDFDFEEAAGWDAEGRSEGLERSNVETLRAMLLETIDALLLEGGDSTGGGESS